MSGTRFNNPVPQYLTANGVPIVGGLAGLYFYEPGTLVAKPTYSDSALQNQNTQPVPLNSLGSPTVEIWLDGEYRVILKSIAGATIWDRDNVVGMVQIGISGTVNTYSELIQFATAVDGQLVEMLGYHEIGDGGGGKFYWDETSTATANAATVVAATGVVTGRFIRIFENDIVMAAAFGIKDDGDGDGGGTDNLNAFLALSAYLGTRERVELIFPQTGGIICWTNHVFISHCRHLVVKTNGCRFQGITQGANAGYNLWWGNDYFTNRAPGLAGFTGTVQMPFPIESVAAGATEIVVIDASIWDQFEIGGRVMPCGHEQQGYGYPPNLRYFEPEPPIIRDLDFGTKTIYLDRPLRNAYRSDWYPLDYPGGWITGAGYVSVIGPAGVIPLDRALRYGQEYLEIDRLEYLKNPYDVTPFSTINGEAQYGSRSPYFQGWGRVKIGTLLLDQFAVGQGGVYEIDYLKCIDLQADKMLDALIIHSGHITAATDGTGVQRTYFGPRVEIKYNLSITGPNVEVDGVLFTNPDSSTGNRPMSTAFFNSAESIKVNGCKFAYADQTGVIAGGNFQEDVTDPDRPGHYSVTATAVASGQFSAAFGDGTTRIKMRKGTKLTRPSDKAVFTVKDIRWDGTDFIILYYGTGTVSVSDKLWYYPVLSMEIGGNNVRIGNRASFPLCDDKIVAQHYTDVDGGMTAGTINKTLQIDMFKINGAANKAIYLDGYIQEIEVNIIKAYSGAGSGNLVLSVVAPNGDSYTATINTKNTGRRRILAASSANAKGGDTLTDLGYDKYIMGAGVTISASDNTGDIGCKGTIRFIGVRR